MQKFSPKNIFLAIFTFLLVMLFSRFLANLSFPDSSINLQKGLTVKLQSKNSLTQKFTTTRGGLTKIEVLLRSPGIEFEKGDRVTAQLADGNCQKIILEGKLQSSFLSSNNLYEFVFPKIDDSKNKTYCLIATFQAQKSSARAIQFFTTGDTENQPLSLRPVYVNDSFWQNMTELNRRMSQYKPWFLKHYFLWFVMIGFIILSIGLVAILITL